MQDKSVNTEFWRAYDARIAEFNAFDPELVIVFGGDHYDGLHLKLMPTFVVGQAATGLADCGGTPGVLEVPQEIAFDCAQSLVNEGFDIATSYAMQVDHGFTNVLSRFLGCLNARPVVPIHINSLCDPRPTFRRCRELGAAVGRFTRTLNKRVAFLGSGGLSHQTDFIFPQYRTAPSAPVRDFIVSGGSRGEITLDRWMNDIQVGMDGLNQKLLKGEMQVPWINEKWDRQFLDVLASGDLRTIDSWTCEEVTQAAGYGGGEIRQWLAAIAAAQVAGVGKMTVDYYSAETTLAVGIGVVHATTSATQQV
jgi:2,3-dihydroxyphenylpropionate 1,2-dioxygenase